MVKSKKTIRKIRQDSERAFLSAIRIFPIPCGQTIRRSFRIRFHSRSYRHRKPIFSASRQRKEKGLSPKAKVSFPRSRLEFLRINFSSSGGLWITPETITHKTAEVKKKRKPPGKRFFRSGIRQIPGTSTI